RAARRQRDRRPPRRRRFQGRDPEILDRREEERAATGVEACNLGVGAPADERHGRSRKRTQPRFLRAGSDDDEPTAQTRGRPAGEGDTARARRAAAGGAGGGGRGPGRGAPATARSTRLYGTRAATTR